MFKRKLTTLAGLAMAVAALSPARRRRMPGDRSALYGDGLGNCQPERLDGRPYGPRRGSRHPSRGVHRWPRGDGHDHSDGGLRERHADNRGRER